MQETHLLSFEISGVHLSLSLTRTLCIWFPSLSTPGFGLVNVHEVLFLKHQHRTHHQMGKKEKCVTQP